MPSLRLKRTSAALGGFLSLFGTAPAAAQIANWNGFYLGMTAGYVRSEMKLDGSDLAKAGITAAPGAVKGVSDNNANFGIVGGQNFQLGFLVWGMELDLSRYQSSAATSFAGSIAPFGAVTGNLVTDVDWTGSMRGRAGIAIGEMLFYGSAGLVLAKTSGSLTFSALGSTQYFRDSAYLTGWSLGGGIEYQIAPVWTLRAEVIHTHIGADIFSISTGAVPLASSIDLLTVRGGLAIRF